jgi:hypothetical protein
MSGATGSVLFTTGVFLVNPRTTIEFKNLYNQIGDHETVLRQGQLVLAAAHRTNVQNYGFPVQRTPHLQRAAAGHPQTG